KQHRTLQEIQNEYAQVCAQLGDKQYKICEEQKNCEILKDKLRSLNLESLESNAYMAKLQRELEEKKNEKP
ncbi:hypothetical protein, partial [Streptococcus pneumoniae]|uniref:hypothetical protein n=1 Tax=Streptococcus pneumoniae TaxID=1313 RepID=UPI0018B03A1E